MQISNKDIGIGILASEKSRRMNVNKAFLKIKNETFIERLTDEFKHFGNIYISANYKDTYKELPYTILEDKHHGVGPMEGIFQILNSSKYDLNFICSVDMPFLKSELLEYLISAIDDKHQCYVLKDEIRLHPTCAIYSKSLIPIINELISNNKYCLLEIFSNSKTKYIQFPNSIIDKKTITNINTQEEYNNLCNN